MKFVKKTQINLRVKFTNKKEPTTTAKNLEAHHHLPCVKFSWKKEVFFFSLIYGFCYQYAKNKLLCSKASSSYQGKREILQYTERKSSRRNTINHQYNDHLLRKKEREKWAHCDVAEIGKEVDDLQWRSMYTRYL